MTIDDGQDGMVPADAHLMVLTTIDQLRYGTVLYNRQSLVGALLIQWFW